MSFAGQVGRLGTVVIATILACTIAGCAGDEEIGSYPATNSNDCLQSGSLMDQNGNRIELQSLKGEPVIFDFIYTSCTQECPQLTEKMHEVAARLGTELGSKTHIVSLSLDPEYDHPAQLREYARMQDANRDGWLFLTGAPPDVDRELAAFGLRRERMSDGSIDHMSSVYLLGQDGREVRQYNGLEVSAATVVRDLNREIAEEARVAKADRN